MYQAGDYIVYGTSGVCRVDEVKPSPFEDEADRQYYTLTPVTGTETIYIPVDSPVFMRPVISREQAETLVRDIPNIEVDHFTSHSMRLSSEHYQEVLQSHDCGDLVQLIKTVYAKSRRSGRRLSQVDQRYRKRAEELLHGELSVALGIPFHEVPAYIESVIGKPGKRTKKAAHAAEASSAEEKNKRRRLATEKAGVYRRRQKGKDTEWFPCPLDTPNLPFCADTSKMCSETGTRGRGSGRRGDCGTHGRPEYTLREPPRCQCAAIRCRAIAPPRRKK